MSKKKAKRRGRGFKCPEDECGVCRKPRTYKLKKKASESLREALNEEFERYCECLHLEVETDETS